MKTAVEAATPEEVMNVSQVLMDLAPTDWARSVVKASAEKVKPEMLIYHGRTLTQIDTKWGEQLLRESVEECGLRELSVGAYSLAFVGKESLEKIFVKKILANDVDAVRYANDYREYVPQADMYLYSAVERLIERNPGYVLEIFDSYRHHPRGVELLKAASLKAAQADPKSVFQHAERIGEFLPADKQVILESAIINHPVGAIERIYTNRSAGNSIRLAIVNSDRVELKKLLEIAQGGFQGSEQKSKMAVVAMRYPSYPVQELERIARDPGAFTKLLLSLRYTPDAPGRYSVDELVADNAREVVREINDLHNEADDKRFAAVRNYNALELYTLMVYGEDELFTSSYNGLFSRLMTGLKGEGIAPQDLLTRVGYEKLRPFIRLASQYHRLPEWLSQMSSSDQETMITRFVQNIEREPRMLAEAVAVADTVSIVSDARVLTTIREAIKTEYARVSDEKNKKGEVVYGILASLFGQKKAMTDSWIQEMADKYHIPNVLGIDSSRLFNRDGSHIEQFSFYSDEDGRASFQNFLDKYKDDPERWDIEQKDAYVHVVSKNTQKRVEIFANRPDHQNDGPDEIAKVLAQRKVQSILFAHRGHSYHVRDSIERIPKIAKIVWLGSCGGYNNLDAVLERSPDAHIISTKGTGSMYVNDPLLKMLADEIATGRNLDWPAVWKKAEAKLGGNADFKNYVPPHRNLGTFVLRVYRNETGGSGEE